MIPFNKPLLLGSEQTFIARSIENHRFCGDGPFSRECQDWIERRHAVAKALLTTSATHALEMAALLLDIGPGDEVIMPSFTFVSTANAFVLRGARIRFVDIRPDTMNIDETLIERAITPNTRAIVPVHYAGVGCDMDAIMEIADRYELAVVEDAAQGILASYRGRPLGSMGHFGVLSFHETKNIHCGEGGALLINDARFTERAEIIREKGTNRSRFLRGQVDKYSWVDIGSSYLPSELNAAFLAAQFERADDVVHRRREIWQRYSDAIAPLVRAHAIEVPVIPDECEHNGHIFWIKLSCAEERQRLIAWFKEREIQAVFHYVPLHSAEMGLRFGASPFAALSVTDRESERILRLPLWEGLRAEDVDCVIDALAGFLARGNGRPHYFNGSVRSGS